MPMTDCTYITMDQLSVGLYVYMDLKWFEHPFAFGHFQIKHAEQINVIRSLGLATIRYNRALSSAEPAVPAAAAKAAAPPPVAPDVAAALAAKAAMIARIARQRAATARINAAFLDTAKTVREIDKNLFCRSQESVEQAVALIDQISDSILSEPELAIHVMGDTNGAEELYFHSLNVTILSMMMARDIGLPVPMVASLGMGALFHDIGEHELPERLLRQVEPHSRAERNLYEQHCAYGIEIGRRLKLAPPVLSIIGTHHEHADGSGYPARLQGEAIGLLARIVAIANQYDELCNPIRLADALTPHEALSLMFAKLRGKFDPKVLQLFIRCLGVYPPGTIVQLSNGVIGMITTVNTSKPMKPMIMIYDPDVPRDEAILVDMEHESDINIAKSIRPAQVPRDIYQYLSPRKRVSYYFDAGKPAGPQ